MPVRARACYERRPRVIERSRLTFSKFTATMIAARTNSDNSNALDGEVAGHLARQRVTVGWPGPPKRAQSFVRDASEKRSIGRVTVIPPGTTTVARIFS
jgi:hypothetical protein